MTLSTNSLYEDVGRGGVRVSAQRVFVVDDDEETREAIVAALADEGHEVIGLEDGREVVECLRIVAREAFRVPDLIAMDVHMPGQSGIEVLELLRTEGWATPVVLFSSFVSDDLRARVALAGASVIIQKPFDLIHLSNAARMARWGEGEL
jgi:CheY-like chemotaxis protein